MPPAQPSKAARPSAPQPVPIDPIWLLKALGFTFAAALVCAYVTLCLLFYQGQWQLVLHPQRSAEPITLLGGLPVQPARFDAAETGSPQLTGAWLPRPPGSTRYAAYTVLYLRGGDGSLAHDPVDGRNIAALNRLGLDVFAFDYRGFGQSAPIHPNQLRMTQDAAAALRYLLDARVVPANHILLYGTGVGASLAASLAAGHPAIPAIFLDSPGPLPLATALADPRTRALPVRALFHEDFPLTALPTLKTPKLLISYPTPTNLVPPAFRFAADPKTTLELDPRDPAMLPANLSRFLDQSLLPDPI